MRPGRIVVLLPHTDDAFGVAQRVKLVDTETFVSEPAVEGFDEPIPPGLPWRNEHSARLFDPFAEGFRDELWPIVHPECSRHTVFDGEDIELVHEVSGCDRILDFPTQCLPGVFIDDGKNF